MLKPFLCVSLLAVFSVFIQDFPPYKGEPCMTTQETAVRETSANCGAGNVHTTELISLQCINPFITVYLCFKSVALEC